MRSPGRWRCMWIMRRGRSANVEARSHIYTFTGCTFTERLYPILLCR